MVAVSFCHFRQRTRLGDVAVFENRQPEPKLGKVTKVDDTFYSSSVFRRLELKPISEQKVENIFVAPPYCQTACWLLFLSTPNWKNFGLVNMSS
jgi:hypothetical protein